MRSLFCFFSVLAFVFLAAGAAFAEDDAAWRARVEAELKSLRSENSDLKKRVDAAETSKKSLPMSSALDKVERATGSKYEAKYCRLEPDVPDICGTGLFFTGEYLLWKRAQSDHGYGSVDTFGISLTGLGTRSDENKFKPEYESGFRVGLGYRLPHDNWDVQAQYTYFRSDEEDTKTVTSDTSVIHFVNSPYFLGIPPISFGLGLAAGDSRISGKNEFSYDVIDLELGKRFKISDSLSVRLLGGPRFARILDKVEVSGTQPDPDFGTLSAVGRERQELWGGGLRAGGESEWHVGRGFSIFGGASASLLATKTSIENHVSLSPGLIPASITAEKNTSLNRITPVVQLSAGAAWNKKLNSKLNLNIRLGYEFTNWFNARVLPTSGFSLFALGGLGGGSSHGGTEDIGIHGLTLRFKLDF